MSTKKDIEIRAKDLIETDPNEALKLYRHIYDTFPEDFNSWDALFAMKASRKAQNPDLSWAKLLTGKYTDEKVANLYSWLIYDKCVKGKERNDLLHNEKHILNLLDQSPQKKMREGNSYPCAKTISIFKIADAHSENLFNARKVNNVLSNLDYRLLSDQPQILRTEQRGDIELASDLEKYFAMKTKALMKLGEYKKVIQLCDNALTTINKFHYNNDIWFKMRIAVSEEKLGNFEKSELLLKELISKKEGRDKWFLYRDISEVYYEQKNFSEAWKYAVNAAYFGNEPHFLIGLYLHQAKILYKLGRQNEGKILAELIGAIINEQGWKDKPEYNRLFQYYQIDREKLPKVNEVLKKAQEFWEKERYGNLNRITGIVISIHKKGKIGRLKSIQGTISDFHRNNFRKKVRNLHDLKGLNAEYYEIEGEDGKVYAEDIIVATNVSKRKVNETLIGKPLKGKVKKVVNFGIFVQLTDLPDGLLHKNNMPKELEHSFDDEFKEGDKINVIIDKETEKGLQLKYIKAH